MGAQAAPAKKGKLGFAIRIVLLLMSNTSLSTTFILQVYCHH